METSAHKFLITSTYNDLNESLRQETAVTTSNLASAITGSSLLNLKSVLIDKIVMVRDSERSQTVLSTWVKVEEALKKDNKV